MGWLIFGILLVVISLGCVVAKVVFNIRTERLRKKADTDYVAADKAHSLETVVRYLGLGSKVGFALAFICLLASSFRIVPANSVAVPTVFGKTGAPLDAGPHFVAPWTSLHTFSTRVQTSARLFSPTEGDQKAKDCVGVAGKDGSDECVDATVRYTIDKAKAATLFHKYGAFSLVQDSLVRRVTDDSLRDVFGKYSPLDAVSGADIGTIRNDALNTLTGQLSPYGIDVSSISLGKVHLSDAVQSRIDANINAQKDAEKAVIDQQQSVTKAQTALKEAQIGADAARATAQGQADANRLIAASLDSNLLLKLYYESLGKVGTVVIGNANGTTPPVIIGQK